MIYDKKKIKKVEIQETWWLLWHKRTLNIMLFACMHTAVLTGLRYVKIHLAAVVLKWLRVLKMILFHKKLKCIKIHDI